MPHLIRYASNEMKQKSSGFWQYGFILLAVVLRWYAYLSFPIFDHSFLVKYIGDTDNDNSNSNKGRMSDHHYHNLDPAKKSSPHETETLKRSSFIYDAYKQAHWKSGSSQDSISLLRCRY